MSNTQPQTNQKNDQPAKPADAKTDAAKTANNSPAKPEEVKKTGTA